MKPCPFCAEQIQDEAIKCRWCGELLAEAPRHESPEPPIESAHPGDAQEEPPAESPSSEGPCPKCGAATITDEGSQKSCARCGHSWGFRKGRVAAFERRFPGGAVGLLAAVLVVPLLLVLLVFSVFIDSAPTSRRVAPAGRSGEPQALPGAPTPAFVAEFSEITELSEARLNVMLRGTPERARRLSENKADILNLKNEVASGKITSDQFEQAVISLINTGTLEVGAPRAAERSDPPPRPIPSKWQGGAAGRSEMDDSPRVILYLDADNEVELWLKTRRPRLFVRCQENRTDAFVVIGGAADVEYGDGHTVQLRFDEGRATTQRWSQSTDREALFSPQAIPFARRLAQSSQLRFRFTPFNGNPQLISFDVRGFNERVGEVALACNWKP